MLRPEHEHIMVLAGLREAVGPPPAAAFVPALAPLLLLRPLRRFAAAVAGIAAVASVAPEGTRIKQTQMSCACSPCFPAGQSSTSAPAAAGRCCCASATTHVVSEAAAAERLLFFPCRCCSALPLAFLGYSFSPCCCWHPCHRCMLTLETRCCLLQ